MNTAIFTSTAIRSPNGIAIERKAAALGADHPARSSRPRSCSARFPTCWLRRIARREACVGACPPGALNRASAASSGPGRPSSQSGATASQPTINQPAWLIALGAELVRQHPATASVAGCRLSSPSPGCVTHRVAAAAAPDPSILRDFGRIGRAVLRRHDSLALAPCSANMQADTSSRAPASPPTPIGSFGEPAWHRGHRAAPPAVRRTRPPKPWKARPGRSSQPGGPARATVSTSPNKPDSRRREVIMDRCLPCWPSARHCARSLSQVTFAKSAVDARTLAPDALCSSFSPFSQGPRPSGGPARALGRPLLPLRPQKLSQDALSHEPSPPVPASPAPRIGVLHH